MIKRFVSGMVILAVSACTTSDHGAATLADLFVADEAKDLGYVETPYAPQPQVIEQINKQPAVPVQNTAVVVQNDEPVKIENVVVEVQPGQPENVIASEEGAAGYALPKRGERYASADYILPPQMYGVVASRAVNKMLADVPAVFAADKNAALYIADMVQIDRHLPEGGYIAEKTAKDIIHGSKMFNIVQEKELAGYTLESSLNNANTPEIPVIVYELRLYDSKGEILGRWSDTMRQVLNDDGSWW